MAGSVVYVSNSNEILLSGLCRRGGDFLNDVVIMVTVKTSAGADVAGQLWPVRAKYVEASDGDYVAGLSHLCGFVKGQRYVAHIDVDDSDTSTERVGHWEFPLSARTRTK